MSITVSPGTPAFCQSVPLGDAEQQDALPVAIRRAPSSGNFLACAASNCGASLLFWRKLHQQVQPVPSDNAAYLIVDGSNVVEQLD
jgi:hypothetical protein